MNLYTFPTKFVYWNAVKKHKSVKKEYYPKILCDFNKNKKKFREAVKSNWNCDCYSSFFESGYNEDIFDKKFINKVIWNNFDQMLSYLNNSILNLPTPKTSVVSNIWYNFYNQGMFQEVHKHYNNKSKCQFSGVYLMHLEGVNNTTFINNASCSSYLDTAENNTFKTDHIVEGNIIIFPSELMHYVNPCIHNKMTLSFNITSEY